MGVIKDFFLHNLETITLVSSFKREWPFFSSGCKGKVLGISELVRSIQFVIKIILDSIEEVTNKKGFCQRQSLPSNLGIAFIMKYKSEIYEEKKHTCLGFEAAPCYLWVEDTITTPMYDAWILMYLPKKSCKYLKVTASRGFHFSFQKI